MSPLVCSADSHLKFAVQFPVRLLSVLRCHNDGAELMVSRQTITGDTGIIDGSIRCTRCLHEYSIEGGIVRMLPDNLTPEDLHEITLKDLEYEAMAPSFESSVVGWRSSYMDQVEVPPHLQALGPLNGRRLLELGCGDGRFTLLAAQRGAEILAVDFSIQGLRKLCQRLHSGVAPTSYQESRNFSPVDLCRRVGLVHADISQLHLAPRVFDRALSATPLDSRDERMNMHRIVAHALALDGRYVAGFEYDDLARRLLGLPEARRYTPGGVFIEHLDANTVRREMDPYFSQLKMRLIRPHLPFVRSIPQRFAIFIALHLNVVPVLRHLAEIVLVEALHPRFRPLEGTRRRGSKIVTQLYVRWKRLRGQEPRWDAGGPVL